MDKNLDFIRKGNTGCVFATILARTPNKIGWKRIINPGNLEIPKDAYIVSFVFEGKNKDEVKQWALNNGMYEDITSKNTTGLRYKGENGVSWVQYFGQDSHVKTRQTPNSELLFCVKLPKKSYFKVGFKGVLHLAHASIEHLKDKTLDFIWDKSHERTIEILGYKPTVEEAAKTTFKNEE
jgi:hypothetical protein